MVCSACGFENLAGMRFCGMCGTPLPHRPLTTPGAQSTLSLTRVPQESGSSPASSRTAVSPEMPRANGDSPSAKLPGDAGNAAAEAIADGQTSTSEAQPAELVPDIPLDQYLQSFHYQPPDEPDEIAMHGDASVHEQEAAPAENETVAPPAASEVTTLDDAVASAPAAKSKVPAIIEKVPPDTVESRLGLEPEAQEEVRSERPKFLDLDDLRDQSGPATSGTSIITGPSFLGLNDPPPTAKKRLPKPRKLRKSHWGAWSAVILILIFAGLGVMQYRSQVNHANNGPLEIAKAKVREWRQRIPALAVSEPAPGGSDTANSKPVRPPRPAPSSNPNETATDEAASSDLPPSNSAEATSVSKPPKAALTSPTSPVTTAASGAGAGAANQEAAPKPSFAGAEEMTKAKNASDAAATAAWLWKATAKGNPDAPVQLADMYIDGQGVPRSCEQAMVLLKTAAEKDNARARNRLASMYATGSCVQRDRVQAYRWLSSALAANPHSDWAQQNRDLIWRQMTPDERAQAEKYR